MRRVALTVLLWIGALAASFAKDHDVADFGALPSWRHDDGVRVGTVRAAHTIAVESKSTPHLRSVVDVPPPSAADVKDKMKIAPSYTDSLKATTPNVAKAVHSSSETTPEIKSESLSFARLNTEGTAMESQNGKWHVQHAIRAGTIQSRGVNLGGWLIGEHWMTYWAEIWRDVSDEVASGGEQNTYVNSNRHTIDARFKAFRDMFIDEEEIRKIAASGLNTVRVPIGYWILGFDHYDLGNRRQWANYAPGGLDYLDKLIRIWAKKHNVAVLISMHGAKGSQNGADHSAPEQPGKSFWAHYDENIQATLYAVKFLAARYKHDDAFLGIGLMNEPSGSTTNDKLYQYYRDAYGSIRYDGGNDCILTMAPLLWEQSPWHMTDLLPDGYNIWVEWHRYFVWGYEHSSPEELMGKAMDDYRYDVEIWKQRSNHKMYIGEMSLATAGKFSTDDQLKEFARRQLNVLLDNVDGGWAFWSWRTYGDEWGVNPWSLRGLLRTGIFPVLPAQDGYAQLQ